MVAESPAPSRKLAYGNPMVTPPTLVEFRYGCAVSAALKVTCPESTRLVNVHRSSCHSAPNLIVWLPLTQLKLPVAVGLLFQSYTPFVQPMLAPFGELNPPWAALKFLMPGNPVFPLEFFTPPVKLSFPGAS